MDNISLIDVNKPEKIQSVINELVEYKNTTGELDVTEINNQISEINSKLNDVESIAKGATQSVGYTDNSELVTALNSAANDAFRVGQNLYVKTTGVPDFWVFEVSETHNEYVYTTDEEFVSELRTNGSVHVGYYVLGMLESDKADLTNVVTFSDYAKAEGDYGLVKLGGTGTGLAVGKAGGLYVVGVRDDEIESESTSSYRTLQAQHISKVVKKGMTSNTQEWTDEDKANARTLIDAVGKTDYGNESTHGIIKASPACGTFTNDGILNIRRADNSDIDTKEQKYRPIVPANLDYAIKSGMTTNSLEWTDEEKTAARTQIDAVGKSDYASLSNHGIVKVLNSAGTFCNEGIIYLYKALESDIDAKEQKYRPIVPNNLDYAVKKALTDSKIEWTEEEQANAKTLLGTLETYPAGGTFNSNGNIMIRKATNEEIAAKEHNYRPIVPRNLDYAVKEGLANNILEWTEDEKAAARTLLAAVSKADVASMFQYDEETKTLNIITE